MDKFVAFLNQKGIYSRQNPKINHDLFTVFSHTDEAKIWLKPCDAFDWDQQMLKKIRPFFQNVNVLSIEDYILSKLARTDRSSIDISDIINLLIANKKKIDWNYLNYRLNWMELLDDFKKIIKGFEMDYNTNSNNFSKEILEKFEAETKKKD